MSLHLVKADLSQLKFFKDTMFTCLNLYSKVVTRKKNQHHLNFSPEITSIFVGIIIL